MSEKHTENLARGSDERLVIIDKTPLDLRKPQTKQDDLELKNSTGKAEKEEDVENEEKERRSLLEGRWPEDGGRDRGEENGTDEEWNQDSMDGLSRPGSRTTSKWRQSMPEGERWMDGEIESEEENDCYKSVVDNQEDEDNNKQNRISDKTDQFFSPQVNILRPLSKAELQGENEENIFEMVPLLKTQAHTCSPVQSYREWTERENKSPKACLSDKLKLSLGVAVAAVLFPLLVWGGYALLPFDAPLLNSAPLRLVYTLRCSFFAILPIMLGVVVQGVARLHHGALKPLYQGGAESHEAVVHWHYVRESLDLFLFYFLQLAVMATYVSQDLLKLVPLLTIVFAFGRLIYWVCLSLGSSVRSVGFGVSFLPMLVMLGANIYFVCSSLKEGAIFDVAPPTTAPPPKQRWFG